MPVTIETGSKAAASDDPPPPETVAGQAALGPMTAMVLDLGCVKRQRMAFVLEQRDAFPGAPCERHRAACNGVC